MEYKKIAWDGISFNVPVAHEVSGIDKKFIQLDDGDKPCIEIRWYKTDNKYNEKNFFRQLTKKVENASGVKIESTVMPASWKEPLSQYDPTAFYWKSDLTMGHGVMFNCPEASQVALIQFIGNDGEKLNTAALSIFESFKFHNDEEKTPWCIYDISALLPGNLNLDSYEFKPGRFNITVKDDLDTISLYRFSPAETILKNKSLGDFARDAFKNEIKSLGLSVAEFEFDSGSTSIFGQDKEPSTTAKTLSKISSRKRPFGRIEIRYLKNSSRITAVLVKSRKPLPADITQNIFENYGIIS
ncbi:hypothetical protein [Maridesulfovibrio bastinii]|uniref:hypothetical protein n=1 Tax=Maridesulfovibrio bastinii TaxID=47157 RepID=UPI000429B59B|nr:hypothetical protein [Maridesulfovibrio bastinii]